MMRDPDLEQLLRRYRPSDPPSGLRARALADPAGRIWPWAAAAAALLALTLGVDRLSEHLIARAGPAPGPDPVVQAVSELADVLGGGAEGQAAALLVLAEQRWRDELSAADLKGAQAFPGSIR